MIKLKKSTQTNIYLLDKKYFQVFSSIINMKIEVKNMDNNEKYSQAKKKVEKIKGFYNSLTAYIIINTFLFILNILLTPSDLWFLFPLIIWGIILIAKFLTIFVFKNKLFGEEWEEKKIKEYMEKD